MLILATLAFLPALILATSAGLEAALQKLTPILETAVRNNGLVPFEASSWDYTEEEYQLCATLFTYIKNRKEEDKVSLNSQLASSMNSTEIKSEPEVFTKLWRTLQPILAEPKDDDEEEKVGADGRESCLLSPLIHISNLVSLYKEIRMQSLPQYLLILPESDDTKGQFDQIVDGLAKFDVKVTDDVKIEYLRIMADPLVYARRDFLERHNLFSKWGLMQEDPTSPLGSMSARQARHYIQHTLIKKVLDVFNKVPILHRLPEPTFQGQMNFSKELFLAQIRYLNRQEDQDAKALLENALVAAQRFLYDRKVLPKLANFGKIYSEIGSLFKHALEKYFTQPKIKVDSAGAFRLDPFVKAHIVCTESHAHIERFPEQVEGMFDGKLYTTRRTELIEDDDYSVGIYLSQTISDEVNLKTASSPEEYPFFDEMAENILPFEGNLRLFLKNLQCMKPVLQDLRLDDELWQTWLLSAISEDSNVRSLAENSPILHEIKMTISIWSRFYLWSSIASQGIIGRPIKIRCARENDASAEAAFRIKTRLALGVSKFDELLCAYPADAAGSAILPFPVHFSIDLDSTTKVDYWRIWVPHPRTLAFYVRQDVYQAHREWTGPLDSLISRSSPIPISALTLEQRDADRRVFERSIKAKNLKTLLAALQAIPQMVSAQNIDEKLQIDEYKHPVTFATVRICRTLFSYLQSDSDGKEEKFNVLCGLTKSVCIGEIWDELTNALTFSRLFLQRLDDEQPEDRSAPTNNRVNFVPALTIYLQPSEEGKDSWSARDFREQPLDEWLVSQARRSRLPKTLIVGGLLDQDARLPEELEIVNEDLDLDECKYVRNVSFDLNLPVSQLLRLFVYQKQDIQKEDENKVTDGQEATSSITSGAKAVRPIQTGMRQAPPSNPEDQVLGRKDHHQKSQFTMSQDLENRTNDGNGGKRRRTKTESKKSQTDTGPRQVDKEDWNYWKWLIVLILTFSVVALLIVFYLRIRPSRQENSRSPRASSRLTQ